MGTRFVEAVGTATAAIPGEHPALSSRVDLGYNNADELIKITKYINGNIFDRDIIDPDIVDYVVDRTVSYGEYVKL